MVSPEYTKVLERNEVHCDRASVAKKHRHPRHSARKIPGIARKRFKLKAKIDKKLSRTGTETRQVEINYDLRTSPLVPGHLYLAPFV